MKIVAAMMLFMLLSMQETSGLFRFVIATSSSPLLLLYSLSTACPALARTVPSLPQFSVQTATCTYNLNQTASYLSSSLVSTYFRPFGFTYTADRRRLFLIMSIFTTSLDSPSSLSSQRVLQQLQDGIIAVDMSTGQAAWSHATMLPSLSFSANSILTAAALAYSKQQDVVYVICPTSPTISVWTIRGSTGVANSLQPVPLLLSSASTAGLMLQPGMLTINDDAQPPLLYFLAVSVADSKPCLVSFSYDSVNSVVLSLLAITTVDLTIGSNVASMIWCGACVPTPGLLMTTTSGVYLVDPTTVNLPRQQLAPMSPILGLSQLSPVFPLLFHSTLSTKLSSLFIDLDVETPSTLPSAASIQSVYLPITVSTTSSPLQPLQWLSTLLADHVVYDVVSLPTVSSPPSTLQFPKTGGVITLIGSDFTAVPVSYFTCSFACAPPRTCPASSLPAKVVSDSMITCEVNPSLGFLPLVFSLLLGTYDPTNTAWTLYYSNNVRIVSANSDAMLVSLSIVAASYSIGSTSANILTPAFSGTTFFYSAIVTNAVISVSLTATAADLLASVDWLFVNASTPPLHWMLGGATNTIQTTLLVGVNELRIRVTAADGITTNYVQLLVTKGAACPAPPLVSFGARSLSSSSGDVSYPITASYSCNAGYSFGTSDVSVLTCSADGSGWSHAAPTCYDDNFCDPHSNGGCPLNQLCQRAITTTGSRNCFCGAGYTGVSCVACSFNTYKDHAGIDACTACPPLSFTVGNASTSAVACTCLSNALYTMIGGHCLGQDSFDKTATMSVTLRIFVDYSVVSGIDYVATQTFEAKFRFDLSAALAVSVTRFNIISMMMDTATKGTNSSSHSTNVWAFITFSIQPASPSQSDAVSDVNLQPLSSVFLVQSLQFQLRAASSPSSSSSNNFLMQGATTSNIDSSYFSSQPVIASTASLSLGIMVAIAVSVIVGVVIIGVVTKKTSRGNSRPFDLVTAIASVYGETMNVLFVVQLSATANGGDTYQYQRLAPIVIAAIVVLVMALVLNVGATAYVLYRTRQRQASFRQWMEQQWTTIVALVLLCFVDVDCLTLFTSGLFTKCNLKIFAAPWQDNLNDAATFSTIDIFCKDVPMLVLQSLAASRTNELTTINLLSLSISAVLIVFGLVKAALACVNRSTPTNTGVVFSAPSVVSISSRSHRPQQVQEEGIQNHPRTHRVVLSPSHIQTQVTPENVAPTQGRIDLGFEDEAPPPYSHGQGFNS